MRDRSLLSMLLIAPCAILLPLRLAFLTPWDRPATPAPPPGVVTARMTPEHLPGRFRGQVIRQRPVALSEKVIALTFDDGPNPEITPAILDVLKQYRAPATFFVVGQCARQWPDLLARAAAEGHAVASHSYSHPREDVNVAHATIELDRTQKAIVDATGRASTLFRPPWGRTENTMSRLALRRGQCVVKWTVCSSDNPRLTAAEIVNAVTKDPRPGDIVLLHDGRGRSQTVRALPEILRRLQRAGYRFVTVPQLLQRWDQALSHPQRGAGVPAQHAPGRSG